MVCMMENKIMSPDTVKEILGQLLGEEYTRMP